jgi:threonine dehydratase
VPRLSLERIRRARAEISAEFKSSPLVCFPALAQSLGVEVWLKLDILNPVRSFKGRGTDALMASLARQENIGRKLVCASAGNLGQALAYSGVRRGFEVTIVAARTASPLKIERMRAFGAEVLLVGDNFDEARNAAAEMARLRQEILVVDSLETATCEGAGTIGLELQEQLPEADDVLVALGNGALATGTGAVYKGTGSTTRVVGVQSAGAPAMALSWQQRRFVATEAADTFADGIAVAEPMAEVLPDLFELVDDCTLVSDHLIAKAMLLIEEHAGILCEPSAAAGVAALLNDRDRYLARKVVVVVCGANIAPAHFSHLVGRR